LPGGGARGAYEAGALSVLLPALEARGERQLSQPEKAARATYSVVNDGTVAELEGALRRLYDELEGERA